MNAGYDGTMTLEVKPEFQEASLTGINSMAEKIKLSRNQYGETNKSALPVKNFVS